ncbi:MAG: molybdopterin-dependent oxidoreductase [Acidobacteria bacterium]|nr:molybdopterin-dependent oxidoreductase [Acidobacteriota bacterium]
MPEPVTRREFLSYSGAALTGVTLGQLGRQWLASTTPAVVHASGPEVWATSVCRECPASCGLRARMIGGVPVKLEGSPLCPIGRGRLCAKGQASLESYFDPDRLIGPARRVGERGAGRWEPIPWPKALDLVTAQIRESVSAGRPGLVALAVDEDGPPADAWSDAWRAIGARTFRTPIDTATRLRPRFEALTGVNGDPMFDLERASHVLSFGAPIVETWLSPVWAQRAFGRFRRGPSRQRGRLVQIDARRSATARKADEWLSVLPEHQALLAYGIASVLLREDRVQRGLLDEFGGNLREFQRDVIPHYTPDQVAAATGIPVVTILRLGRDLADSPRPVVVVAADANNSLIDAVFALNALIGAFDRPGGVFVAPASIDRRGVEDEPLEALGDLKPRVVALADPSPFRTLSASPDLGRLLEGARFVVSLSPYLDETAAFADLLLPTHTPLESWHCAVPAPAVAAETRSIAMPAVKPRLDTADRLSLVASIARRIGAPEQATDEPISTERIARGEIDRLWRLRRGGPYSVVYETEWLEQLERGGWWAPAAESREDFTNRILQAGGWIDPYFQAGQIEQSLRERRGLRFALPVAIPAVPPAKIEIKPVDGAGRDGFGKGATLRLVTFTPAVVSLAGNPNQPVIYELLGQPDAAPWQPWAELHPETAARLGIESGHRIRITSRVATIEAVAMLVEGMLSDVVAVASVPSVPGAGRWARVIEGDARSLVALADPAGPRLVVVARA